MPRKRHNHSAFIDPLIVENMIASGENLGTIALRLACDRTTLYKRSQRDPELRAAVKRGQERLTEKKVQIALAPDTADELESLLWEMAAEVRSLRKLAA